jgi:hypothetical protein
MRTLVDNFHRSSSLFCIGWGGVQIIFAYTFGGYRLVAYPVAIACAIVTMILWFVLPVVGRRYAMKTISTKYYGVLRAVLLPSFFGAFVFPFLFY